MSYINKINNIDENCQLHESSVIVIALDKSNSMGGSKWTNVRNGAKYLINFI